MLENILLKISKQVACLYVTWKKKII